MRHSKARLPERSKIFEREARLTDAFVQFGKRLGTAYKDDAKFHESAVDGDLFD